MAWQELVYSLTARPLRLSTELSLARDSGADFGACDSALNDFTSQSWEKNA